MTIDLLTCDLGGVTVAVHAGSVDAVTESEGSDRDLAALLGLRGEGGRCRTVLIGGTRLRFEGRLEVRHVPRRAVVAVPAFLEGLRFLIGIVLVEGHAPLLLLEPRAVQAT